MTTTNTPAPRKNRAPVRALNHAAATVAAAAKAEKDRKAASKAALRAAAKAQNEATYDGKDEVTPAHDAHVALWHEAKAADRHAAEALAFRAALEVDARSLGHDTPEAIEAYVAEQIAPPKDKDEGGYCGPMIALKTARLSYVKAANGIACNGDRLATLCGAHERKDTVAALILAMGLEGNPYKHLNPGQQSMNLRNKARHAIANGMLSFEAIERAYTQVTA